MKRCERYWEPVKAARMQEMVKSLCGGCLCTSGVECPLFSYKTEPLQPLVSPLPALRDEREVIALIA